MDILWPACGYHHTTVPGKAEPSEEVDDGCFVTRLRLPSYRSAGEGRAFKRSWWWVFCDPPMVTIIPRCRGKRLYYHIWSSGKRLSCDTFILPYILIICQEKVLNFAKFLGLSNKSTLTNSSKDWIEIQWYYLPLQHIRRFDKKRPQNFALKPLTLMCFSMKTFLTYRDIAFASPRLRLSMWYSGVPARRFRVNCRSTLKLRFSKSISTHVNPYSSKICRPVLSKTIASS